MGAQRRHSVLSRPAELRVLLAEAEREIAAARIELAGHNPDVLTSVLREDVMQQLPVEGEAESPCDLRQLPQDVRRNEGALPDSTGSRPAESACRFRPYRRTLCVHRASRASKREHSSVLPIVGLGLGSAGTPLARAAVPDKAAPDTLT